MSAKKVGVLRFLGTNCDQDIWKACQDLQTNPEWLWYEDQFEAKDYQALIIPGGFSYGDYLRCGALAAKSSAMKSVAEAANQGVPVLGICNGFQVLCETGLLPGALLRNQSLKFIDDWVELESQTKDSFWSFSGSLKMPIAHGEGRYFITPDSLKKLEDQDQIWVSYKTKNPNGSVNDIAGVISEKKNVGGLMPHPERALKDWMGATDGRKMLAQFLGI